MIEYLEAMRTAYTVAYIVGGVFVALAAIYIVLKTRKPPAQ